MTRINGKVSSIRALPLSDLAATTAFECIQCGIPTKGGKLYCSRHVERMPYAARLARRVQRRRSRRRALADAAA